MQARIDNSEVPQFSNNGLTIAITEQFAGALRETPKRHVELFFTNLRLNLQGRILGLSTDDLIKLQGKLDYLAELEKLFTGLVK